MVRLPPGPRWPLPLTTYRWVRQPVDLLRACRARYGPTFTLKLPPGRVVFLCRPDDIRTVFTAKGDEMHAGAVNTVLRVLVGQSSVLVLDGPEHLRHRKLLLPSFHGDRMRHYGETMAAVTRANIAAWPLDEAFPMHESTQRITLEIILRTVFGASERGELDALAGRIQHMMAASERPASMPLMFYLSTHPELEARMPWKWLVARRNRTDALLFQRIREARSDPHHSERSDVLSMLLGAEDEKGQPMSDGEIRDELMTALAAGHETTATALAWAFEKILSTPRVLDRLRDEIDEVTAGDAPVERLASAPYLDATIKEVLRLRPVVPIVGRVLQKPFGFDGFELPAGSFVAPCIYLAHREPELYEDPEVFRPERFLGKRMDPYAWLPFGGGIRRCLGAAFATYEMKIVLGTMLGACELELAQPVPIAVRRRAITFWPEHGTRVRLRARRAVRVAA